MTPRAKTTPITRPVRAGEPADARSERLFADLPTVSAVRSEEDAAVALFAAAGITVEVVATCGDASCPECFATRSDRGRGDRLAA